MKIILICLLVFILRFMENYLVRAGTISTLTKRAWAAVILDIADETFGLLTLIILVVDQFYFPYCVSSILGTSVATFMVSRRWPKVVWNIIMKKKKSTITYRRKQPFTNA